jgi:phosphate:Na+ symporter
MRRVASIAGKVAALPEAHPIKIRDSIIGSIHSNATTDSSTEEPLIELERCAKTLSELRRTHRSATLSEVAKGMLTADEAIVRVDTVRNLEMLTNHAWRSTSHLIGRGD